MPIIFTQEMNIVCLYHTLMVREGLQPDNVTLRQRGILTELHPE